MSRILDLYSAYDENACCNLDKLECLREELQFVPASEIRCAEDAGRYIALVNRFRAASARADKLKGDNYPDLLKSLLSVGEDGLYSNNLRFIFELIQNVDDCDYQNPEDCKLDMRFDFNNGEIVLTYNEVGFSPYNVFAITGIAEAAKNISASKNEIGEKGIGFKSVFGVADHVQIQSGWFSFALYKENFTIPVAEYQDDPYCPGTKMTLFVGEKARSIYRQIKDQYCRKEALFSKNPLLFLNKLTSLKLYYDTWRSMEFHVSRSAADKTNGISREDHVTISVNLRDYENGSDRETVETISCARYTYPVSYGKAACQSRYGANTKLGSNSAKQMLLQAVVPYADDVIKVGNGGLYSFLPTQLSFTVPIVCHAPFKLDASREFVDPQEVNGNGGNIWFKETATHLSELLEYVYQDWCTIAKQSIVSYLPPENSSLFARNNGKEKCLSSYEAFRGSSYLKLPLFYSVDGEYKSAQDIFYFDPAENVPEPERACRLLAPRKALFLVPAGASVGGFGITVERNVFDRLFRRAFLYKAITEEILEYLDSTGYEYSERQLPTDEDLIFHESQILCFFKHKRVAEILLRKANDAVRNNRRPAFSLTGSENASITNVLPTRHAVNDTPEPVKNFIKYSNGLCCCMDIPEECYLPCKNGIILSETNPLTSFAAFCYSMDPGDTFSILLRLNEASKKLDRYVESNSGSASDFIRDLANIRKTVRESIGKTGYRKYLELIMRSGSDRNRYIQELLQNADDCSFPEGCKPSFSLRQQNGKIITEYNETGFSRADIRSITAIGESTKGRLIRGETQTIGQKGVGFKTVFAIASEIKIYSGEFNFSLSAEAPTIPVMLRAPEHPVTGTRMEITLRNTTPGPIRKEKDILELCLCLRRLRNIDINGCKVSIVDDEDDVRTISIDNKAYRYKKYIYRFSVGDKEALRERENETESASSEQQIVCYVPEKRTLLTDYPLYVGLPTRHRLRIPMAIDAPFELTTSREEIEVDFAAWNGVIRREMYQAIIQVIHARKQEDRASILRFARAGHHRSGLQDIYSNELSDSLYINAYDFFARLRREQIFPTFAPEVFVSVAEKRACCFPEAATYLMRMLPVGKLGNVNPETILDTEVSGISKEQKERNDAVIKALSCENADFSRVFPLFQQFAEDSITEEAFRENLYTYLQETPETYQEALSELKIIPVYGVNGGVQFISWDEDSIFVKKNCRMSDKSYWVLNETMLPKSKCEQMLGVNINEMTAEWERSKYNENLRQIIRGKDVAKIYDYLLSEYRLGNFKRNNSFETLYALKEYIPLKNQLGEIVDTELYTCDQPEGYFSVKLIQRLIVHKECESFAQFLRCRALSGIHFEEIDYFEPLTSDDVEMLTDSYFLYSNELLMGFYRNGLLSDELLGEYGLEYLSFGKVNESYTGYDFPEDPVGNLASLKKHVQTQWQNPIWIVPETVQRTVYKGKTGNGKTFDLSVNDTREGALHIYTPEGVHGLCFCQMCTKLKAYGFMEVNNIQLKPEYYFPQLRVALCLECSKRFEALRNKEHFREEFIKAIKQFKLQDQGTVDIPIENERIKFTAKHLAEIQEILKRMPKTSGK